MKKNIVVNDLLYLLIISRIIIFIILIIFPIELTINRLISPNLFNKWVDYDTYNDYFNNIKFFVYNYKFFFSKFDFLYIFPGPIFPTFLKIFDYKPGNTIVLSALLVVFELFATIKWASYINFHFNKIWAFLFIFNPITIYASYLISPDIIFYFIFTYFYMAIVNKNNLKKIILYFLILTLVKPHALFFFPIMFFLIRKNIKDLFVPILILSIILILYYLPYAIDPLLGNPKDHMNIDFIKICEKFKELFFLKESESLVLQKLYFFKVIISLILIIGFIYSLRTFDNTLIILPYIIIILVIYYPTWRYIFFFYPIFFVNFIFLVKNIFKK